MKMYVQWRLQDRPVVELAQFEMEITQTFSVDKKKKKWKDEEKEEPETVTAITIS